MKDSFYHRILLITFVCVVVVWNLSGQDIAYEATTLQLLEDYRADIRSQTDFRDPDHSFSQLLTAGNFQDQPGEAATLPQIDLVQLHVWKNGNDIVRIKAQMDGPNGSLLSDWLFQEGSVVLVRKHYDLHEGADTEVHAFQLDYYFVADKLEAWFFEPEPERPLATNVHDYLQAEMLEDARLYLSWAADKP